MKMIRRLLFISSLLLAFFFAPSELFGQTAGLRGVVTDADTGMPLLGANVVLKDSEVRGGASTDSTGAYEILPVETGVYTLTVSYLGYKTSTAPLIEFGPGEIKTVDMALTPAGLEINPIIVTASRRPEKMLDAPAAITVIEGQEVGLRTSLTAAEHLKTAPAVDLVSTGINQSRIVIRGFNDNLASSLLTLVDNRVVRVPSFRLTALQLIPVEPDDIERIEILSGPASALYGPNSANGVVHIQTRSPFDAPGTSMSLSRGERDIFRGSLRHAGVVGQRLGYKVFAHYYTGNDFEYIDPVEMEARQEALSAGAEPDTLRIGQRDFRVANLALDGRLDYRFATDGLLTLTAGMVRGDNLETSPTGGVQVHGAMISYVQAKASFNRLFAQIFYNALDSGDSFALRTGMPFRDNSNVTVAQVQHAASWGSGQEFTYGIDYSFTQPRSGGTVNGRFEDRDNIHEVGAYAQSETRLDEQWMVYSAARLDYHHRLDILNFSPRIALVFKPRPSHTLRATYNRAFKTPNSNQLFTDVLGQADVFQGRLLEPLLGFSPSMDLRAQGSIDGFHFRRNAAGNLLFRSPYAGLDPRGLSTSDYIDPNDPVFGNVMWQVAREAAVQGLARSLAQQRLISPDAVDAVSQALDLALPAAMDGLGASMQILDITLDQPGFVPVSGVDDIEPLKVTRTETFELGYKGLIDSRLLLGLDVYYTRVKNFIGPFLVGTPTMFLDARKLQPALLQQLRAVLADPGNAALNAQLRPIDELPIIGNRDGSAAAELAFLISTGIGSAIPFGTVTPEEAFDPASVVLMRRNFGDISLYGLDVSVQFFLTPTNELILGGTYSFVSENFFENVDGVDDVALNAPRNKFSMSLQYIPTDGSLGAEVRLRHVGEFPVRSDIYIGRVDRYTLLDLSATYDLPFSPNTNLTLTIQNLLNNNHQEFVFTPEIGRVGIVRLAHTF